MVVRVSREGDWELHLSSIRIMLPWFYAYDRVNYTRYRSAYWLKMCTLETTHYQIYCKMTMGQFAVQTQDDYGFAKIPCGQVIGETCNRD